MRKQKQFKDQLSLISFYHIPTHTNLCPYSRPPFQLQWNCSSDNCSICIVEPISTYIFHLYCLANSSIIPFTLCINFPIGSFLSAYINALITFIKHLLFIPQFLLAYHPILCFPLNQNFSKRQSTLKTVLFPHLPFRPMTLNIICSLTPKIISALSSRFMYPTAALNI